MCRENMAGFKALRANGAFGFLQTPDNAAAKANPMPPAALTEV